MSSIFQTVLVVEDDSAIRETLSEALATEGYKVVSAQNGQEALDLLRNTVQTSLVLLDLMMPIMNGREFLDVVMHDGALKKIPVLIVSATVDAKSVHGAVGYVKKPVDLDSLLSLVARHATA